MLKMESIFKALQQGFAALAHKPHRLDRNRTGLLTLAWRILHGRLKMGRGILLWLLGVPIPIILLLAFLFR